MTDGVYALAGVVVGGVISAVTAHFTTKRSIKAAADERAAKFEQDEQVRRRDLIGRAYSIVRDYSQHYIDIENQCILGDRPFSGFKRRDLASGEDPDWSFSWTVRVYAPELVSELDEMANAEVVLQRTILRVIGMDERDQRVSSYRELGGPNALAAFDDATRRLAASLVRQFSAHQPMFANVPAIVRPEAETGIVQNLNGAQRPDD